MRSIAAPWRVRFSPRTPLAINGAALLASERNRRGVPASELAGKTGAVVGDLRAVLEELASAGFVEPNVKGAGCYRWRRDPARVSLYEIACAVGERFDAHCTCGLGAASPRRCKGCPFRAARRELQAEVIELFKAKKLDELIPVPA